MIIPVQIISKRAIDEACGRHGDAADALRSWFRATRTAHWRSFLDLRETFPDADDVDGIIVFNIRHNRYRLLASVKYFRDVDGYPMRGRVYIGAIYTHAEYDRWCKLSNEKKEKALWPQP